MTFLYLKKREAFSHVNNGFASIHSFYLFWQIKNALLNYKLADSRTDHVCPDRAFEVLLQGDASRVCSHMSKHTRLPATLRVTLSHTYFLILTAFSPTVVFHQKRLWCISNGKFSTHHFEERNKREWEEFSSPDSEKIKTSHGKGIREWAEQTNTR